MSHYISKRRSNRKILEDGRKKNGNNEVETMRKIDLEYDDEKEEENTKKEEPEEEEKDPKVGKRKNPDPTDNPGTLVTPEGDIPASSGKDGKKNDLVGNGLEEEKE